MVIEFSSRDLTELTNNIDSINAKIEKIKELLNSGFVSEKQLELYTNGFNKLETLLQNTNDSFINSETRLKEYYEEFRNIEEVFKNKFDNIATPKIKTVNSIILSSYSLADTFDVNVETASVALDTLVHENQVEKTDESVIYEKGVEVPLYDMSKSHTVEVSPIEVDLSTDDSNIKKFNYQEYVASGTSDTKKIASILGQQASTMYRDIQMKKAALNDYMLEPAINYTLEYYNNENEKGDNE